MAKPTATKPVSADFPDVTMVITEYVDDNPFQSRKSYNNAETWTLAMSIYNDGEPNGLLVPLMGRMVAGGRVQLVHGHRRLRAIRTLIERSLWEGGVPVTIVDMTDEQMFFANRSENDQRSDVGIIENIRGMRYALDTIEGMTVTKLATQIEPNEALRKSLRTTIQHQLSILVLPDNVLQLVESGKIGVRHARELLAFVRKESKEPLDIPLEWLRVMSLMKGDTVHELRNRMSDVLDDPAFAESWRPLEDKDGDQGYRPGLSRTMTPAFDVDAFKAEHKDDLFLLPIRGKSSGRWWTTAVVDWEIAQAQAQGRDEDSVEPAGGFPDDEPVRDESHVEARSAQLLDTEETDDVFPTLVEDASAVSDMIIDEADRQIEDTAEAMEVLVLVAPAIEVIPVQALDVPDILAESSVPGHTSDDVPTHDAFGPAPPGYPGYQLDEAAKIIGTDAIDPSSVVIASSTVAITNPMVVEMDGYVDRLENEHGHSPITHTLVGFLYLWRRDSKLVRKNTPRQTLSDRRIALKAVGIDIDALGEANDA